MKTIIFLLLFVVCIILFVRLLILNKTLPINSEELDRGNYTLILGKDASEIFVHFGVLYLHGLSYADAVNTIDGGGSYIDGLTNYHPNDKGLDNMPIPFMFLNISSLQNNYSNHEVYTCIMHECMHMAGILYNGCWDSHEEEMIMWAEKEANEIIIILKNKKYI